MTKRSTPSLPPNPASERGKPGGGWPIPQPGDVLSYAYLWAREAAKGQEEGLKDRPVVVVLATVTTNDGTQLLVAPITHSQPDAPSGAMPLPANVKRDLGLDREQSWIILTEVNRFVWPGPDVRPLAGGDPYYGAVPDWLFLRMREAIAGLAGRGGVSIIPRSD